MTERGRLDAFTYLTVEKAALYRAVMGAFVAAKERFVLHLRPAEVTGALGTHADPEEVDGALRSLVAWGNLSADADTAEVATVEEFYRSRYLYRLTPAGEAAERAVRVFEETIRRPGELQTAALADIHDLLAELAGLAAAPEPDAVKIHRVLRELRARFEELTDQAQTFIASLQRTIDLQSKDLDEFLAYKDGLIGYLERFVGELVVVQPRIAHALAGVEAAGVGRLLDLAAERDLADAFEPTEEDREAARAAWRERWAGLRAWFAGGGPEPSQAEVLRARARSAITQLVRAVATINERRLSRTDRAADLRTLARWFAECETDADAHRLWRAAFALGPARHLAVDQDTLAARDQRPVPAATSWLDADPLRIAPRLRRTGRFQRRGAPSAVVDRSAERALLAEMAAAEAAQLEAARERLLAAGRVRLSELGHLDRDAFDLFLDLLGEALAAQVRPTDTVRTASSDGALEVVLEPTGDGRRATVETSDGRLHGPDHWVTVRDAFAPTEAVLEEARA